MTREEEQDVRLRTVFSVEVFGFELFVFTVDLDLISIQLRHAVNAKREATVYAHLRESGVKPRQEPVKCADGCSLQSYEINKQ